MNTNYFVFDWNIIPGNFTAMKYWVLSIILLLPLSTKVYAQVNLGGSNSYSLNGNVFLFEEKGKPLSVEEAWKYYSQKGFKPVPALSSINLGFVKHVYWLAVPVKNTLVTSQTLIAGIDNGGIFHLEYYLLNNDGNVIIKTVTGTNYDFYSRAIPNRHFYFPLNLAPGIESVIFYRIDMRGNGFNIPLRIVTKEHLQNEESHINVIYAFFFGWMIFVVFLSIATYLWTKVRVYLFYSLYVASYCMFFIGDGNFDVQFIYPHSSFMSTISPTVYALCSCMFTLFFMNDFLQLKTTHKTLFQLSRLWTLLLVGAMIMVPCGYAFSTNIALRIFVFSYCLVAVAGTWIIQIYSIILRVKDKFKPAYLYAAALAVVMLCTIVYVFHVLNIMPDLLPAFVYLPIGFSAEIIVLSLALIYSYSFYKNQHQQLSLSIANQQLNFSRQLLQVQEAEQKRIAEDLHDELGGNLAAIKMNLQSLEANNENLGNIIRLIDTASTNARNIAHNLMPPEFEKTTMEELLQNFFNKLNREGRICFNFYKTGTNGHFDKHDELIIYRIILELTNNIIKHSQAAEATVQLINYDTYLEIMAEDNGRGFNNKDAEGIGLKNILSRVNFLQGIINIDTGNSGTTVMIKLPYKK